MPDSSEPTQSPLAFASLDELVDELLQRSDSACISLLPFMDQDYVNNAEDAYTAIKGKSANLAWMAMLIMAEVQMTMMRYQRPMQSDSDRDVPRNEDSDEEDIE